MCNYLLRNGRKCNRYGVHKFNNSVFCKRHYDQLVSKSIAEKQEAKLNEGEQKNEEPAKKEKELEPKEETKPIDIPKGKGNKRVRFVSTKEEKSQSETESESESESSDSSESITPDQTKFNEILDMIRKGRGNQFPLPNTSVPNSTVYGGSIFGIN